MKKVAFFSEIMIEDFDGASRTMFQLINRINTTHFQYLFIYGRGPSSLGTHQSLKIPTIKIPVNSDYSLAFPSFSRIRLEQALKAFKPDVIHIATPSLLGFFALQYAKRKNIPVISIYHTHFISYIAYYLRNFSSMIKPMEYWTRKAMLRFYNACHKVYVPSNNMIKELKQMGIESERMHLWQRGIDIKLFNKHKRDEQYIRQITKNNKPNILFTSRLVWEKNIQTLIEIYGQLSFEGNPFNLLIAGDGTAKDEAMYKMPKAFFLGKLDHEELSTLYASADVFLFTSTSETYGNVIIEAMASGLPCVIANAGGSADLVEHQVTGFKCVPNNAKEYLYYVKKILSNPTLKQSLQEEALQFTQQLDWNKLADRYFEDVNHLAELPLKDHEWVAS